MDGSVHQEVSHLVSSMDIENTRREHKQNLPDTLWDVYNSSTLGRLLATLTKEAGLQEARGDILTNIIGDAILGIYKTNEIPKKLQNELGLGADDAQRIMGDLSGFLAPVIERERAAQEPNRDGLKELQQSFKTLREEALHTSTQEETSIPVSSAVPANLPIAQHLAADDTALPTPTIEIPHAVTKTSYTVEPMRTMASDVTRIHGYGAYRDLFPDEAGEQAHKEATIKAVPQEELLKERVVLAEKPNYNE